MSNSNNRRSNNRSAGSKPPRRTGDAAKAQRAGAESSAVKRASEEAAEAVEESVDDAAEESVDESVHDATDAASEPRTAAAKARRSNARDGSESDAAPRRDAARSDSTPRLPDDGTPAARERPTRSRSADGSSAKSSAKPRAKSSAKQAARKQAAKPSAKRRARPSDPDRRPPSARNGDAAAANGAQRSSSARRPESSPEPTETRPRRRVKAPSGDAPALPERAERAEQRGATQRYEVFYGEAEFAVRDRSLEALWYEIADQWGPSDVGPIALVPVPPMTTSDAARYAERFASIGAAIDGDRVKLITALDLWPSDTSLAREIEQSRSERTAIVLESPSLNPASIPIIRRCTTVVPVVQLGLSDEDEVGQLVAGTGRAPSTTMLCIDRPKRRRGLARLRRRPKATAKA